jgi:hypothetical protein
MVHQPRNLFRVHPCLKIRALKIRGKSPFVFGLYVVSPAMILGERLTVPCLDLCPGLRLVRPERMIGRQA